MAVSSPTAGNANSPRYAQKTHELFMFEDDESDCEFGLPSGRKKFIFGAAEDEFLVFCMIRFISLSGPNALRAQKRELIFKEDGQEYAQVVRMLGNGRLEALCFDGKTRLGHIRGKMRKKVWVSQGDIVLCGLRDFQDQKCDIILKYSADEARNLKAYGELPAEAKINEDEQFNESEDAGCPFEFGEPDDAEEGGVDLDEI